MARTIITLTALLALFGSAFATIYFKDTLEGTNPIGSRWVVSKWKQDTGEAGEWEWSGGKWSADSNRKGLRTSQDARFYAISAKLDQEFNHEGKPLVLGFSVKHEQKIDCGGGYVKLLPPDINQEKFNGETPYTIMFGPDICGYSTKKIQAIFNHKGENLLKKSDVKSPDDEYTHFYQLIVNSDDTYQILVDGKSEDQGKLKDAWGFEQPKKIKDPNAKKPSDWIDEEMVNDPSDVKPADWDNEPEKVLDPSATKPEDWDEEEDGKWEAPLVDNPNYKGEWKPKKIKNENYKGPWIHPEIDNPKYAEEANVYQRGKIGYIGIEIWQVKSGTIFSDFIVSDSIEEVEQFYNEHKVNADNEKKAKEAFDGTQKTDDTEDIEDLEKHEL